MLEAPRKKETIKEVNFYRNPPKEKKKKSIFKNFYITITVGFVLCSIFSGLYYWAYFIESYEDYKVISLIGIIVFMALVLTKAVSELETEVKVATISRICLIDEYEKSLGEWDILNKSSLVIGKSTKSRAVDIDLSKTKDEYLISKNHAVMNYAGGNWYIEDLGSAYGVGIKKANGTFRRRLKIDTPYKVEIGDIIYINKVRLMFR